MYVYWTYNVCMSTKVKNNGIKIKVNEDDHPPAHVHATKGKRQLRIDLKTLKPMDKTTQFTRSETVEALELVLLFRDFLMEEWNAKHPKRK